MEVGGHRNSGIPKLRLSDVTRTFMKEKWINIEEAQDRRTWTLKTRYDTKKCRRRRRSLDRIENTDGFQQCRSLSFGLGFQKRTDIYFFTKQYRLFSRTLRDYPEAGSIIRL